jgi:hypothetical protein
MSSGNCAVTIKYFKNNAVYYQNLEVRRLNDPAIVNGSNIDFLLQLGYNGWINNQPTFMPIHPTKSQDQEPALSILRPEP